MSFFKLKIFFTEFIKITVLSFEKKSNEQQDTKVFVLIIYLQAIKIQTFSPFIRPPQVLIRFSPS